MRDRAAIAYGVALLPKEKTMRFQSSLGMRLFCAATFMTGVAGGMAAALLFGV